MLPEIKLLIYNIGIFCCIEFTQKCRQLLKVKQSMHELSDIDIKHKNNHVIGSWHIEFWDFQSDQLEFYVK